METDKFKITEKKFINLCKRRDEINSTKRKIQWKEIEEPYQDGWELSLGIKEHTKNRDILIKLINENTSTCTIKDPLIITKIRKSPKFTASRAFLIKKDYQGKLYYYGPSITSINERQFLKIPEGLQKFYFKETHTFTNRWGGEPYTRYTFKLSIAEKDLIIKVKKRIITHIQDIDPKLIKEEAEIDKQLSDYYRKTGWHGHRYDSGDRFLPKNQRRNLKTALRKIIKKEIEDIYDHKKLY